MDCSENSNLNVDCGRIDYRDRMNALPTYINENLEVEIE